jgi:hypothetical protein
VPQHVYFIVTRSATLRNFRIDASPRARKIRPFMANPGKSSGKTFRPSAFRLFLFLVSFELPLFFLVLLIRFDGRIHLPELLLGAALIIPLAILLAGLTSFLLPAYVSAEGIRAHSAWGLPSFIRWQDIKSARRFNFPFLPWLRLFPADGSTVVWLILFQSSPAQFKLEIEKLAPPGNPILTHL